MPVTFSGAFFSDQSRSRAWARLIAAISFRVQQGQASGRCSVSFPSRDPDLSQPFSLIGTDANTNTEAQTGQGIEQPRQGERYGSLWRDAEGQG